MKKVLYISTLAILAACSSQSTQTKLDEPSINSIKQATLQTTATLDSEETIRNRVKEIYTSQNNHTAFSHSFKSLIDKVNDLDASRNAEIGYIDHDVLTQAQDDIEIIGIYIADITATTATANITTNYHILTVKLVKEDEVWKVDNVNNERENITEYIKSNFQ